RPGGPEFPQVHHIDNDALARTPDRHGEAEDRAPNLTPSNSLDPPMQLDYKTTPLVPVVVRALILHMNLSK
ncbi:hypothetical protein TNCV_571271, partial [Trichonephila clavipes]